MPTQQKSVAITDRSSIGEARRLAVLAAEALGFEEGVRSDIAIVTTEIATNILHHAERGEVLVCPWEAPDERAAGVLDLLALDTGNGIADVSRAMEDGFSTRGTAGQGLGAVDRQSDACALYSLPGRGTALWSRFAPGGPVAGPAFGAVNIPIKGETVCGDAFAVVQAPGRTLYALADGLGHGPAAHEAAEAAIATVRKLANESPAEILSQAHDALRSTRGAAMSLAVVDSSRRSLVYAGIGNVAGLLAMAGQARSMVSQNGTLGAALPRTVQEFTYPIDAGTMLVMFSDGLNSKCSLAGYPGLQTRHPELVAGVLYRDFSRRRDDATVLVARLVEERP